MNPKNILKVAKIWHFKNRNKPIRSHRQICLSKVTSRALIGQKQKHNKGNSCFSCLFSVSSNSQQSHAVKKDGRKINSNWTAPKCVRLLLTEVSHKNELPVKSRKFCNDFHNSTGQISTLPLRPSDDNQTWLLLGTKVSYLTKICSRITSKIVRSLKILALTGFGMEKQISREKTGRNPKNGATKTLTREASRAKNRNQTQTKLEPLTRKN